MFSKKVKDKKMILIIFLTIFVVFILLIFYFMIFNNPKKAEYNISENITSSIDKNNEVEQKNKDIDKNSNGSELDELFYNCFPRLEIPKIIDDKSQNLIYIYSLSLSSNFYVVNKQFKAIDSTEETINNYRNLLDTCVSTCGSNLNALNNMKEITTGNNKELVKQLIKDYENYNSNLQSQKKYIDNNIKKKKNTNLDFLGKYYDFEDFKDIVSQIQKSLPTPNNDNVKAFQEYEEYNLSKN